LCKSANQLRIDYGNGNGVMISEAALPDFTLEMPNNVIAAAQSMSNWIAGYNSVLE
jgi:hypothetical protein